MNRPLLIIGCYPNTNSKKQILLKNLNGIKDIFDIMLTSHYPIDLELQQNVKYVVYDSVNDVPPREPLLAWCDYGNVYVEHHMNKTYNPGYSVYRQIRSAITFAKQNGYNSFFYMEGDAIIDDADIDKILQLQVNALKENKSATFFKVKDEPWWDCWLFYSEIDFFLYNTPALLSSDEFSAYCEKIGSGNFLESFLYHLLRFPHVHKTQELCMRVDHYLSNSLVSLTTVNDIDEPHTFFVMYIDEDTNAFVHYHISLLRLENSNDIFVTYQTGRPADNTLRLNTPYTPDIEFYINDMLMFEVKQMFTGLFYVKYNGTEDVLNVKLLDNKKIVKEYSVSRQHILDNPNFIRFK